MCIKIKVCGPDRDKLRDSPIAIISRQSCQWGHLREWGQASISLGLGGRSSGKHPVSQEVGVKPNREVGAAGEEEMACGELRYCGGDRSVEPDRYETVRCDMFLNT